MRMITVRVIKETKEGIGTWYSAVLHFFFIFCLSFCFSIFWLHYPKNAVLFAASLFFYLYGVREHPVYLLLMLLSILVNGVAARCMMRCKGERGRRICLAAGMVWNLGCLFVFKYLDFLSDNLNLLFDRTGVDMRLPVLHLVLPIGISFYTFSDQFISD